MTNPGLSVEVLGAHDLIAKDGEGSSSPFVELHFDGQKFRTTTKEKDLNPVWNETFFFNISDPNNLSNLTLDAFVYSHNSQKKPSSKSFLGKVHLTGTSFVPHTDSVALRYPLEKKRLFSQVKGELRLKVFVTDGPSTLSSVPEPTPALETVPDANSLSVQKREPVEAPVVAPEQVSDEKPKPTAEEKPVSEGKAQTVSENKAEPISDKKTEGVSEKKMEPVADMKTEKPTSHKKIKPNSESKIDPLSHKKTPPRHTFHHLPNPDLAQKQKAIQDGFSQPVINYAWQDIKSPPRPPQVVRMYPGSSAQQVEYGLKETSPQLGGGKVVRGRVIPGDRPASNYDLVEKMHYLFVRVVKAHNLPAKDITGSLDPYVEVKLGNYKGTTKHFEKNQNPEWNEVFAFAKENEQASVMEVVVKDRDMIKDDFVGHLWFDVNEIPTRVQPDSPLAPQWYSLEEKNGEKGKGQLMLAIWYGTQADEAFPGAWHSDAFSPGGVSSDISEHIRSKVYHSPRLWYVRVNVIEAQDLVPSDKTRFSDVYVKVQIGNQVLKTRSVQSRTLHTFWNEDMMLVAAEPFEDLLVLSVEDRVGPNKDESLGKVVIPLSSVERRADDRIISAQWYTLDKSISAAMEGEQQKKDKFSSRLHLRVCLDGGYHVLDESTQYSSDLRPSAKPLWKPSIGVLELGVLNADGLHPMKTRDGKGTADAFCVAKYGYKWVRTRTIVGSLTPKYNEQYTWEVYDPATVLTIGMFDNGLIGGSNENRDTKIGKLRIRLSTLEAGRVYTHSYPLLVLHPSGVKKMGELHLAIRFSCTSLLNMMHAYSRPLLPKMHYIRPLTVMQQEMLRHHAVNIVAARLSRAEPPLRKEVVEYISDVNSHLWSMRRSKANFFRIVSVISGLLAIGKWFGDICTWKTPVTTGLVHILYSMLLLFPDLILPTIFLYSFLIGIWNWRYRPRYPPHMNTKLSCADAVSPDELDEEFDMFPSAQSADIIRMRYDRLRSIAGRIQSVVGDLATQLERMEALLSWRDPRATAIFVIFCLVAAIVLYVTPFQLLALLGGFYTMRHPRFRHRMPSAPFNFFRRLPARTDSLL